MSGATSNIPHDHSSAGKGGLIPGIGGTPTAVVATLTNKSGGGVIAGDVVILDSANDDSFTTTTSANVTTKVGIAQATIANNAAGLVAVAGYVALVNVTASATRGHFLFTSTTVKKATGSATFGAGAFGVVAKAGVSPSAVIFAHTDQGGGGGAAPFDIAGATYRFPAGGGYAQLAQEDPGDGSDAYVELTFGELHLHADDGSGHVEEVNLLSNGNIQINPGGTTGSVVVNVPASGVFSVPSGKGIRFPNLAADPTFPTTGSVYFNTGTNKLRCYDGSSWIDLF
jgi:hypothetical protein